MFIRKTIKLITLCLFFSLMSQMAMADPCVVERRADNNASSSTLRYIVEYMLNGRTDKPCNANGYEDGNYVDQYVGFLTPETEPSVTPIEKITLGSVMEFDTLTTVIIGNPSEDAIMDPDEEVGYNRNNNAYVKNNDGTIKDYGLVILDGQNLDEQPIQCTNRSDDVFLRNMIIITNGFKKNDIFSDCIKNGGNNHICNIKKKDYTEGLDPRTDDDWCKKKPFEVVVITDFIFDPDDFFPFKTWYQDNDGDGYGDPDTAVTISRWQEGFSDGPDDGNTYVRNGDDCDDTSDAINPDATEVCDGVDNNCDGGIDNDADDTLTWYADSDEDGFGDSDNQTLACDQPAGFVEDSTDCDDTNIDINTDAEEICDEIDNDCDIDIDEDAIDPSTWYLDADTDGFGDANNTTEACTVPTGYVDNDLDCDDTDSSLTEVCEGETTPEGSGTDPETECSDETDNDSDGLTDCDDDGCDGTEACDEDEVEPIVWEGHSDDPEAECSDGLDNDGDNLTDCDDPGCRSMEVCNPTAEGDGDDPESECADGLDGDGDGLTDCEDSGCDDTDICDTSIILEGNGSDAETVCADDIDNDGDGKTDCEDLGCQDTAACDTDGEGAGDDAEAECSDGLDNDFDGFSDCNDRACKGTLACDVDGEGILSESDLEAHCSDGFDNDSDDLNDCEDPGCATALICGGPGIVEEEPEEDIVEAPSFNDNDFELSGDNLIDTSGCQLNQHEFTDKTKNPVVLMVGMGLFLVLLLRQRDRRKTV